MSQIDTNQPNAVDTDKKMNQNTEQVQPTLQEAEPDFDVPENAQQEINRADKPEESAKMQDEPAEAAVPAEVSDKPETEDIYVPTPKKQTGLQDVLDSFTKTQRIVIYACLLCLFLMPIATVVSVKTIETRKNPLQMVVNTTKAPVVTAEPAPLATMPPAAVQTSQPLETPQVVQTPAPTVTVDVFAQVTTGDAGELGKTVQSMMSQMELDAILISLGLTQEDMAQLTGMQKVIKPSQESLFASSGSENEWTFIAAINYEEPFDALVFGMTDDRVPDIQERLMELGFMEQDEPTDFYGNISMTAVMLFQRQHGLSMTGSIDRMTYDLLVSEKARSYVVKAGDQGTDVTQLQHRLRELGYMNDVTGFYGELTENAVKEFQKSNGLTVNGAVDGKTRELIHSENAVGNYSKLSASDVKKYQQYLKNLGYLTTYPDGIYGEDTKAAVKRFQGINGLVADGYLGPSTRSKLGSSSAKANALQFGMSGNDVKNVQKKLANLGYMTSSQTTGYFGTLTENAVLSFQKANGLTQDGVIGKQTMSVLLSGGAKGGYTSGGSTSASKIENFISIAKGKLGTPYVFATQGPDTFDCSGFVYWCLNKAGVSVNYMTSATWQTTEKFQRIYGMENLKRGDVISFKGHVGIYLGDGAMIDASSGQGKVRITYTLFTSNYWQRNFVCGYRIF